MRPMTISMRSGPHGIGPHLCHKKVRREKIVLKLQILKKYLKKLVKYSKNYHMFLNFTAQSTNLTLCAKSEAVVNLAFFNFMFSKNGSFSGWQVKISKSYIKKIHNLKLFTLYIIIIIEVFEFVKGACKIEFFKNPLDFSIILPLF